jgi:hypothetical protein
MSQFVSLEDVRVRRTTDKALLCLYKDSEFWVPKSQLHPHCELRYAGDHGVLRIPLWLARVKLNPTEDDETEDYTHSYNSERNAASEHLPPAVELIQTKQIYRKLATEFHPDHSSGDAPTMRALNQLMDAVQADITRARRTD